MTEVVIGDKVTTIGKGAFGSCEALASVVIGESVTTIGESAFGECTALTDLTINSNTIAKKAYNSTSNLADIFPHITTLTYGSSVTSVGNLSFWVAEGESFPLEKVTFKGTPAIGFSSFCRNTSLETISGNAKSVSNYSFYQCCKLTSITITDDDVLEYSAFNGCTALTSVTLPDNLATIGEQSFYGCSGLTEIVIPETVTTISSSAFSYCTGLTLVTNENPTPQSISSNVFTGVTLANVELDVPYASLSAYKSADVWKSFGDYFAIGGIKLTDGTAYTQAEDTDEYTMARYSRTFKNTNWQSIVLPFSLDYEDWKDNFEIADLYNVLVYDNDDDGTIDKTTIEAIKLTEGKSTVPNVPYLIKARVANSSADQSLTKTGCRLYAADDLVDLECSNTKQSFVFHGTYSGVTGEDMYNNGYYALSSAGQWCQPSSANVSLKPYRSYLEIVDKTGGYNSAPERLNVVVRGEEEAEGIESIHEEQAESRYTIAANMIGLKPGVYSINGRKIEVK